VWRIREKNNRGIKGGGERERERKRKTKKERDEEGTARTQKDLGSRDRMCGPGRKDPRGEC